MNESLGTLGCVYKLAETAVCDNARTVVWEVPPVRAVLPD